MPVLTWAQQKNRINFSLNYLQLRTANNHEPRLFCFVFKQCADSSSACLFVKMDIESVMERKKSVLEVISYKEGKIAMQRKSVVIKHEIQNAVNTKRPLLLRPDDLNLPPEVF